jgi:hypothetical protein
MPDQDKQPPVIPHFEDVNAPIIYADACWGGGRMNGDNLTLTFAATILDHSKNPPAKHTKTVLRLVLPKMASADLADFIKDTLARLEVGQHPRAVNSSVN